MIDKYNKIFSEVLSTIKPEKKYTDNLVSEVNRVTSWFNIAIRSENIIAECTKGGSFAKGTFLKNDHDVDLFVKFSHDYKEKEIKKLIDKVVDLVSKKLKFDYKKVHGSRDYYQFVYRDLNFEVVPVIKIFNVKNIRNTTDASPLHVAYMKKQIAKNPALPDQIRLAKQFCKAAGVYGSESYIKGFSGHSLDLLLSFYKSFINFVSSTKYWEEKMVIDVEGKLKEPLKLINKSKQKSPIILVDPVDNSRNATAALSKEKFDIFIQRCSDFLESPSVKFFKVEKMSLKKVKEKFDEEEGLFFHIAPIKNKSKDVQGTAILKALKYIVRQLKKHDFNVLKYDFDFENMYIIVKKEELSSHVEHRGPPKRQRKACKEFTKKYSGRKKVFEKNKRLYVRIKRKYMQPKNLVKDLLKEDYVKSRIRKIKLLQRVR
jgi:tRNA nucleotidyltransferase (CCA-adding enzyme)